MLHFGFGAEPAAEQNRASAETARTDAAALERREHDRDVSAFALFANQNSNANSVVSQDDADAEEGSRFSAALHGLVGGLDQGHAAIPARQRQPDLCFEFLRLKSHFKALRLFNKYYI